MWDETGGLRVVDVDHVAGLDELDELGGGLGQRRFVDLALGGPQRAAVAVGLVQVVVDPLCHPEELRVAGDGQPADVDTGTARIGEQRMEQLRHASPAGCRVDVPDHPAR